MEEELYECKVEVKQQNTLVPTSVRTIESVIDVPGWAPVTPYLNMANSVPTSQDELKAILSEAKANPNMQYIKPRFLLKSPPTEEIFRQCGHLAKALFSVLNKKLSWQ